MFTGIIEQQGKIKDFSKTDEGARVVIDKPGAWNTKLGDSIAVQGACLTIVSQDEDTFSFDLMPETLEKTTLSLKELQYVNLEQATIANKRLDGHIVTGHVDVVGVVENIQNNDGIYILRTGFDSQYAKLVVMKGSVTIDGVSLTVTDVGKNYCEVSLIPYTLEHTTLGGLEKGASVNIEFDMIGKYINRFMETHYAGK